MCLEYVVFYSIGEAYGFGFGQAWFPGKVPGGLGGGKVPR